MALPMQKLATYEDYSDLPDDGRRYELIQGRIVVVPAPLTTHQRGSHRLSLVLGNYVSERKLGEVFQAPTDVIFGEHDTVQPDLLFVSRERADRITRRGIEGAPDLVIEILSEATASRDCIEKREIYERGGVREFWIVDPETRSISVLVLESGAFRLFSKARADEPVTSKLFPEIVVLPGSLFEPPAYDE